MAQTKKHPLDGYDYTADVPVGTPLLVTDGNGRCWRLSKRGVRYHADVSTRLHGAKPARPPKNVAASDRIRAILEDTLGAGELPSGIGEPVARWRDAPYVAGSSASMPELAVYADGWVRACVPVYDDAPRLGARQLTERQLKALLRDLELAPRGARLPRVTIRERTVRIEGDDPRAAEAAQIEGARALATDQVFATQPGYAEALEAPGASLSFEGGPVSVPRPGTGWEVPVTAWRALAAERGEG